ncbi:hypothetical protein D3C80_1416000 [compost metagenome]
MVDVGKLSLRIVNEEAVHALGAKDILPHAIRQRQIRLLSRCLPQIDQRKNSVGLVVIRLHIQLELRTARLADITKILAFGDAARDFPDGMIRLQRPRTGVGKQELIARRIGFQRCAFFAVVAVPF